MSRPIMPGQYPQALGEFLQFDAILLSDRMSGGNQCIHGFRAQCALVKSLIASRRNIGPCGDDARVELACDELVETVRRLRLHHVHRHMGVKLR